MLFKEIIAVYIENPPPPVPIGDMLSGLKPSRRDAPKGYRTSNFQPMARILTDRLIDPGLYLRNLFLFNVEAKCTSQWHDYNFS
jgi:hypothetical protein